MSYSLCGTVGANTAAISCDVRRGLPKAIIFGGATFQPSDYVSQATIQAAIKARTQRATGISDKLYCFPEVQGNTDQTDADKIGTLGYGLKIVLLQGKPAYQFTVIAGSTQEKNLRKFNNKTIPVYVFDDGSNFWGKADSAGIFSGCDCLVSVKGKGFDDAQNAKTTEVTISFINASDFYDTAYFVQTTFSLADLAGMVDVVLSEVAAHTTNVFHIQAKVLTTQLGISINPYDQFSSAMASASLWIVKNVTTGAVIPTTSVAVAAGTKSWDVTIDTTAYGALAAAAPISFAWADPATLATAGVTGSETPAPLQTIK